MAQRHSELFYFGGRMDIRYYRQLLEKAVQSGDRKQLDQFAAQLVDCENTKQALRLKGYGCLGMPLVEVVKSVPRLRDTLLKEESQQRKG